MRIQRDSSPECKSLTETKNCVEKLTDFEVEDVVGAHCLAPVLEELLNVHGDGQALELATPVGELVDPLRSDSWGKAPLRLSVYCLISLITNRIPLI